MSRQARLKLHPEMVEDVGVALCTRQCGSWRKDTVATEGRQEVKVTCSKDKSPPEEVIPRPVCLPWVRFLYWVNRKLARLLTRFVPKYRATIIRLKREKAALEKENKKLVSEGVEWRSKERQLQNKLGARQMEITKLNEDVMIEDLQRQRQWAELKEVQEYRKNKARFDKFLAQKDKELEKLRPKIERLQADNLRMLKEDQSKGQLIKKHEATIDKLQNRISGLKERLLSYEVKARTVSMKKEATPPPEPAPQPESEASPPSE